MPGSPLWGGRVDTDIGCQAHIACWNTAYMPSERMGDGAEEAPRSTDFSVCLYLLLKWCSTKNIYVLCRLYNTEQLKQWGSVSKRPLKILSPLLRHYPLFDSIHVFNLFQTIFILAKMFSKFLPVFTQDLLSMCTLGALVFTPTSSRHLYLTLI